MKRSILQNLVGGMSVTGFIAALFILDRTEALTFSLRVAVWFLAISVPVHAACFARNGAWFDRVFFSSSRVWPTVVLVVSSLLYLLGITYLFHSLDRRFGMIFLVVAAFVLSQVLPERLFGPADDDNS